MEQLIFYKRIESLNSQTHKDLKITPAKEFLFAEQTNSVPVTGAEFAEVCKEYPIAFAKGDGAQAPIPVAVLGIENHENLFLSAEGTWAGTYLPAFVRRYPFVLAGEPDDEELTVCVDRECSRLREGGEGEPLFIDSEPSAYLRETLQFLQEFQRQVQHTAGFSRKLLDLGLLVERQVEARTPGGERYTLSGLWVVDETALGGLAKETVFDLFRTGELALIYLHMVSLGNLNRLMARKNPTVPGAA